MHPLLDRSLRPVVGHRGNAAHAPENTIESFVQAVALGVDALELDVRLSRDGRVMVHHDPAVDRTTDGRGDLASMSFDELRRLDAGARFTRPGAASFPYRGRGIGVPTLDEVLERFPSMPLLVEIKTAAASAATRLTIERHGARDRTIVASFDAAALVPFHDSGIPLGSSQRDTARLLPRALLGLRAPRVGFSVMCMPPRFRGIPLPVGGYARSLAAVNVPVHVWTIDDPGEARRLWARGVCGIISNDPAAILAERQRCFPR